MEEEKNILDATEYILMALNNIKNYNEFIEYKEEIEKAVYDIRNSITDIINQKKNNKPNLNNTNRSSANKPSISSMLGLKFNYDTYLNDLNFNNLNQNNLNNNQNNFNDIYQNNEEDDLNKEENLEENRVNKENINNQVYFLLKMKILIWNLKKTRKIILFIIKALEINLKYLTIIIIII